MIARALEALSRESLMQLLDLASGQAVDDAAMALVPLADLGDLFKRAVSRDDAVGEVWTVKVSSLFWRIQKGNGIDR